MGDTTDKTRYQQGATNALQLKRQMQAAGNTTGARLATEAVDANLDALSTLTTIEQGDQQ